MNGSDLCEVAAAFQLNERWEVEIDGIRSAVKTAEDSCRTPSVAR